MGAGEKEGGEDEGEEGASGLSRRAVDLLGFAEPCRRCGHDFGLHNVKGDCSVLDCECREFVTEAIP